MQNKKNGNTSNQVKLKKSSSLNDPNNILGIFPKNTTTLTTKLVQVSCILKLFSYKNMLIKFKNSVSTRFQMLIVYLL